MLPEAVVDDVSLVFADWGKPVTYQVVSQTLDHETLLVSEEITEVDCLGLVTSVEGSVIDAAGGNAERKEIEILVRGSELPEDCPALTDRIVMNGQRYVIDSFQYEPHLEMYELAVTLSEEQGG